MYGSFESEDHLNLLFSYYPGGDFFFHLNQKKNLLEKEAKLYFAEIILALEYLHKKQILYRDLKVFKF